MVLTVTAPLWSDISDRQTRKLGQIYVNTNSGQSLLPLNSAEGLGLLVTDQPWTAHHRQGRQLMYDDFEGTLKWSQTQPTVTKASDPKFVHTGTSAMKLLTGAVANDFAVAELYVTENFWIDQFAVMEFWWTVDVAAVDQLKDFWVTWVLQDRLDNQGYMFGWRYYNYNAAVAVRKMQYWNSAGAWVDVNPPVGFALQQTSPQWHHWAIILQKINGPAPRWTYRWFWFDTRIWVNAGTAGENIAYSSAYNDIAIGVTTNTAVATAAYVDDFVLMDEVLTTDF